MGGYNPSDLKYLKPNSIQISKFNPPILNSKADKEDLNKVLRRIRKTTKTECANASTQAIPDVTSVFGQSLSQSLKLTQEQISLINDFFINFLWVEVDYFVHEIKEKSNRQRPFLRNSEIATHQKNCMPSHPSTSYLSGHAALSRLGAHFLRDLFPRSNWFSLSNQAAQNRVLAGLHHPTDIQDGIKLADEVYSLVKKNSSYQEQLKELKKQL